jgi:hypothetical protein
MENDNDWTFPLSEIYWAFGDDSVTEAGAFFGFVLIPENRVAAAESILIRAKEKYGGRQDSTIHCRTMFPGNQRSKSDWSHLDGEECGSMISEVLAELDSLQPLYVCTFWPRQHYPKTFRLKGKNGHSDLVHAIDDKWMVLWSFQHTATIFDPISISEPSNPLVTPSPKNKPYWRFVARRADRGPFVSAIHLDRDTTKVRWFSKTFQWETITRELVVETPRGASTLPFVELQEKRHPLIEIADIFVYTVSRQLSDKPPLRMVAPASKPLVLIRGQPIDELVLG